MRYETGTWYEIAYRSASVRLKPRIAYSWDLQVFRLKPNLSQAALRLFHPAASRALTSLLAMAFRIVESSFVMPAWYSRGAVR